LFAAVCVSSEHPSTDADTAWVGSARLLRS
jgi:hypothetical protein